MTSGHQGFKNLLKIVESVLPNSWSELDCSLRGRAGAPNLERVSVSFTSETLKTMAKRALIPEDKEARRAAILETALRLFHSGDGELPTASQVASATGLAKGTVYIYFQTKEEIFATLLLEGWIPILEAIKRIFDSQGKNKSERVRTFIANFAGHLRRQPELLQLDVIGSTVLERNMPAEVLTKYQSVFGGHVIRAGESIDRALDLESGRGVQILVRTHALARGLWLSSQHNANRAGKAVPRELALTAKNYANELKSALEEYWRGALAHPHRRKKAQRRPNHPA